MCSFISPCRIVVSGSDIFQLDFFFFADYFKGQNFFSESVLPKFITDKTSYQLTEKYTTVLVMHEGCGSIRH